MNVRGRITILCAPGVTKNYSSLTFSRSLLSLSLSWLGPTWTNFKPCYSFLKPPFHISGVQHCAPLVLSLSPLLFFFFFFFHCEASKAKTTTSICCCGPPPLWTVSNLSFSTADFEFEKEIGVCYKFGLWV